MGILLPIRQQTTELIWRESRENFYASQWTSGLLTKAVPSASGLSPEFLSNWTIKHLFDVRLLLFGWKNLPVFIIVQTQGRYIKMNHHNCKRIDTKF